jgi:16S rRNA (uracil1498-N3)-methyltransferase
MQYFHVSESLNEQAIYIASDAIDHQLRKVLRLRLSDEVVLVDVNGFAFLARIEGQQPYRLKILRCLAHHIAKEPHITLALSLIKRDAWELALQKATELGVDCILPIQSERSVVRWDDFDKKRTRYESIMREAAEQCERLDQVELKAPVDVSQLCAYEGLKLFADARHQSPSLFDRLSPHQKIVMFIGPEGGLSERERSELMRSGFLDVSLGPRILRSETAVMYALSVLMSYYGK